MRKKIVSFTLSEKTVENIDKTSKAIGMSRSELLELMINKGLHFPEAASATLDKITELQAKMKEEIEKKVK